MSEDENTAKDRSGFRAKDRLGDRGEGRAEDGADTQVKSDVERVEKTNTSAAVTKLLLLLAIVFALTKWGVPVMDSMVDKFKEIQEAEASEVEGEKEVSSEVIVVAAQPEAVGSSDEEKLQLAIETEINQWVKKALPESSAKVKFINANHDGSRLAVEYMETNVDGESESKELLFTRDEFGIYIFVDVTGVRQIRVRQPK